MGDSNVFNTFSFNKWADTKKEEEITKESRRRRDLQMKRLKERLIRERQLREGGGADDLDLEALIEALQRGEEINEEDIGNYPDTDMTLDEIKRLEDNNCRIQQAFETFDDHSWKYNRRHVEGAGEPKESAMKQLEAGSSNKFKKSSIDFKYNRLITKT